MRFSRTLWRVTGGALVLGALAVFGAWSWRMRSEADMCLRRAERVESRGLRSLSRAAEVERRMETMEKTLKGTSNRMEEVLEQLKAERATHEPLRRQIEKMATESITFKDRLLSGNESLKDLRETLAGERQKHNTLKNQVNALQDRVTDLESDLKMAVGRDAEARREAAEHLTRAENARVKLGEAEGRMQEALRRLEASERAVAELKREAAVAPAAVTTEPVLPEKRPDMR